MAGDHGVVSNPLTQISRALLEDVVQRMELFGSGHQAVRPAKQMKIGLILMDILEMPDMDGIQTCRTHP